MSNVIKLTRFCHSEPVCTFREGEKSWRGNPSSPCKHRRLRIATPVTSVTGVAMTGAYLNDIGVMSGGRRAPQLSNPEEISLWNKLIQMQGTVLYTSGRGNRPGVQFTYTIRGAELFASTKEKSITRASIISAYWKAKELDGFVSGPKKLGVFGASYLYPVFIAIGVIKQIPINERDSEATIWIAVV